MVKDAYRFALPPLIAGIICVVIGSKWPGGVLIFLGLFVFYFFRDPESHDSKRSRCCCFSRRRACRRSCRRTLRIRSRKTRHNLSRGVGCSRTTRTSRRQHRESGISSRQVSGGFSLARVEENEQNVISMDTAKGRLVFKQIAGAIARRVICWKQPGEKVALGERVGLIRFGSRVDIWLPAEAQIVTQRGQKVKGGESILARWNSTA